jgi:hypothetical protein
MRKSSWVLLGICLALAACLGFAYFLSQTSPEVLTQEEALQMLHRMQDAVVRKDVGAIMATISPDPDTRIANMNVDQLQLLLARAFRNTGKLRADVSHVSFQSAGGDATLEFDLNLTQENPQLVAQDYQGHITIHLRRVEVSHLLGLYKTREWRVVAAETTGPDPSAFGDY